MARDRSTDSNPREAVDRDTDELLAWLDGELPAKRATEVARAIEKSPLLQSRLRELQWDLQLHSDLSKNELPPSAPALEDALQDFKTRLTRECEIEAAAESALCAVIPIRQSWLG